MSQTEIRAQAEALRQALGRTSTLDDPSRAALTLLQREIELTLDMPRDDSVAKRLEELAVRFETEHPAAGTAIREVVDSLVKVGI